MMSEQNKTLVRRAVEEVWNRGNFAIVDELVTPEMVVHAPTPGQEPASAAWDKIAPGYDEFVTSTHTWVGSEGLRRANLAPGMRFLDVASGSGALSIPAARLGAQVLAVDFSPTMLERLNARARKEGLANLETCLMDGHALELEDNTFDVAGSQFGVMLFPDLPRGLAEMARVTRPGGRVLMIVFGPASKVEFLTFFIRAIQAAVPGFTGLPPAPPPLPFQVADPAKLRQALANAGLKDIEVETTTEKLEFASGQQMWNWVTNSNPIGAKLVADLTGEQKAIVQQALETMLRERAAGPGPAILTSQVHIGIGIK